MIAMIPKNLQEPMILGETAISIEKTQSKFGSFLKHFIFLAVEPVFTFNTI
jgi:hypothetical protein